MAAARKKFALTPYRKGPRSAADGKAPTAYAVDNTEYPTVQNYPVNRKQAKADAEEWDARAAAMRDAVLARKAR